jgi:hypothetical protein
VLALLVAAVVTGIWWLLAGVPVVGYGTAWASHWLIERNTPAAVSYPLWSFAAGWKMVAIMLRGGNRELAALAQAGRQHGWAQSS